jgi:hypothetical protein
VDRAFDSSLKKIEKIRIFLKQYEILINSISDFKKNLLFVKKYTIKKSNNFEYQNQRKDSNCISSRNSGESVIEISNTDNFNFKNGKSNHINLRSSYLNKKNNDSKFFNKIFLDGTGIVNGNGNGIVNSNENGNGNKNNNGNKLIYYFDLLENIKSIEPNLKQHKLFIYDYYKAASVFYVESMIYNIKLNIVY